VHAVLDGSAGNGHVLCDRHGPGGHVDVELRRSRGPDRIQ
jgi:hypothetical protein